MSEFTKTLGILDEVEVGSVFGSGYALLLGGFLNRRCFRGDLPDQPLQGGNGRRILKLRAKIREVKSLERKEIPPWGARKGQAEEAG